MWQIRLTKTKIFKNTLLHVYFWSVGILSYILASHLIKSDTGHYDHMTTQWEFISGFWLVCPIIPYYIIVLMLAILFSVRYATYDDETYFANRFHLFTELLDKNTRAMIADPVLYKENALVDPSLEFNMKGLLRDFPDTVQKYYWDD